MDFSQYITFSSGETVPFTVTQDGMYMNQRTDIDLIKYQINNNFVSSLFRIFVLYADETIAYEIPQDDIKLGGSYNENYQNGQRRSLSFSLYNDSGKYTPDINKFWAGTRLKLEMGIQTADNLIIWFSKGVYVINKITPNLTPSGREVQISANDKFALFEGSTGKITETYEIPIGSMIEDVIRDTLYAEMGNSAVLDPQDFIYNSVFKGKKTQSTISKSAGDTLGSILLELATQLSAEIFYNAAGNLVVIPINEVCLDKDKPLIYEFESAKGDISQLDFNIDYDSIINRIIVVGNTSNGGVFRAVKVNDDVGSPLCYQRIGYRTGNIINDSNITSDVLAEERAEYELRQQLILKSSTSASVLFNPLLEVNNLIAISDDFFELNHERFLLQSVSCSLDYSGQMNITFSNLKNLPFVVD